MIPPLSDTMNFFVSASVAWRMDSDVMLGTNTLPTSLARPAAKHSGVKLSACERPCSSPASLRDQARPCSATNHAGRQALSEACDKRMPCLLGRTSTEFEHEGCMPAKACRSSSARPQLCQAPAASCQAYLSQGTAAACILHCVMQQPDLRAADSPLPKTYLAAMPSKVSLIVRCQHPRVSQSHEHLQQVQASATRR